MGQDLGHIFRLPLSARYLDSTVNLLNGRFNCPRTNGTDAVRLVVVIVDNAMTMLFQISAKVFRVVLRCIPSNRAIVSSTFPCHNKACACRRRLREPPTLWRFSLSVIPIEDFPPLLWCGNGGNDIPHSIMTIPQTRDRGT